MSATSYIIAGLAVALAGLAAAYVHQRLSFTKAWEEGQERLKQAIADPLLTGIHIGNGTIDVGMEGAGPTLLAGMFLGMFEKYPDAKNYIECQMTSRKGDVIVTVRKKEGLTPHAMRRQAEEKLAEAEASAQRYVWLRDEARDAVVHALVQHDRAEWDGMIDGMRAAARRANAAEEQGTCDFRDEAERQFADRLARDAAADHATTSEGDRA